MSPHFWFLVLTIFWLLPGTLVALLHVYSRKRTENQSKRSNQAERNEVEAARAIYAQYLRSIYSTVYSESENRGLHLATQQPLQTASGENGARATNGHISLDPPIRPRNASCFPVPRVLYLN